jgi:hypothetical protein
VPGERPLRPLRSAGVLPPPATRPIRAGRVFLQDFVPRSWRAGLRLRPEDNGGVTVRSPDLRTTRAAILARQKKNLPVACVAPTLFSWPNFQVRSRRKKGLDSLERPAIVRDLLPTIAERQRPAGGGTGRGINPGPSPQGRGARLPDGGPRGAEERVPGERGFWRAGDAPSSGRRWGICKRGLAFWRCC